MKDDYRQRGIKTLLPKTKADDEAAAHTKNTGKEAEREGVVKYSLKFTRRSFESSVSIDQLDQWRYVLFNLQLIGQDPARYHGLGFGNISCRVTPDKPAFLISGSQTGQYRFLGREHCSVVTACQPELNRLEAYGECKPSSEAMTHGVLYAENKRIGAVVHVHSPLIWNAAEDLALLSTPIDIPYGTPSMAEAVVAVSQEISLRKATPVFIMQGHKDGVVAYGADLNAAVMALLTVYSRVTQRLK